METERKKVYDTSYEMRFETKTMKEFVEMVNQWKDRYPEDCNVSLRTEYMDYDIAEPFIEITLFRDENDLEMKRRLKQEEANRIRAEKAKKKQQERAKILKQKKQEKKREEEEKLKTMVLEYIAKNGIPTKTGK